MAASGKADPSQYYVDHHLTNLVYGKYPDGHWGLAHTLENLEQMGFWAFNVDTLFFSVLMAAVAFFFFLFVAKRATSGEPGRLQSMIEMLVDMSNNEARSSVKHGDIRFIAPVALVIFSWIALMNSLKFLPVDLLERIMTWTGLSEVFHYGRLVPTTDLNAPLGAAVGVILLCFFYSIKVKGAWGFVKEWFNAPFGTFPLLWPINFVMNIIEYGSRTVSLAMRLWGNMFAGEIIFLLIAVMGATVGLTAASAAGVAGQVILGSMWAIFHIMIVFLQAYIFMMLALAYLGLAHEDH